MDRIFQNVYLQIASELPFGRREYGKIGKLRDMLQSIKHRYTQIIALDFSKTVCLVLLSIVRCVSSLGIFRSSRVLLKKLSIPNGAGI